VDIGESAIGLIALTQSPHRGSACRAWAQGHTLRAAAPDHMLECPRGWQRWQERCPGSSVLGMKLLPAVSFSVSCLHLHSFRLGKIKVLLP